MIAAPQAKHPYDAARKIDFLAGGLGLHRRFEEQVKRSPEACAVGFGGETLTFRELERRANRLACLLRAKGVGKGAFVAVERIGPGHAGLPDVHLRFHRGT